MNLPTGRRDRPASARIPRPRSIPGWGLAGLRTVGATGLALLAWMSLGTGLLVGRGIIADRLRPVQAGILLIATALAACYWPVLGRQASAWRALARVSLLASLVLALGLVALLHGLADPGYLGTGAMLASLVAMAAGLACAAATDPHQPPTGPWLAAQAALGLYAGAAWCFTLLTLSAPSIVGQGVWLPWSLLAVIAMVTVIVPWLAPEARGPRFWRGRPQRSWLLALLLASAGLVWLAGLWLPRPLTLLAAICASAGFLLQERLDATGS